MPSRSPEELPAVISVTEMARKIGLSRSRFYDLIQSGIMPSPVYCIRTRRPMFLTEQQVACLRVKATNIGVNGEYVLFYSPRRTEPATAPPTRRTSLAAVAPEGTEEIVTGLRALGLTSVTPQQVASALRDCFPSGWQERDGGEVLRACWTHLRRSSAV